MGFHTYGVYITETTTYYYFDNVLIGSEATLPLSWRDGNFFMINGQIDGTKEAAFPDGYGFTRYGDECDMYVDWVQVWEAPPAATPTYNVSHNDIEVHNVTPGSTLNFAIDRTNDIAKNTAVTYAVTLPEGMSINGAAQDASGEYLVTFGAGSTEDQITVQVADSYLKTNCNILVTPEPRGYDPYHDLTIMTINTDTSFHTSFWPTYNAATSSYDINIKLTNTKDVATPAGSVVVTLPDGTKSDPIPFGSLAANGGNETVTLHDVSLSILATQTFGFDFSRDDGYVNHIDRQISGLIAANASPAPNMTTFNAADWATAQKVHLGVNDYYGSNYPGEANFNADQYIMYDSSHIYIAEVVKDIIFFDTATSWDNTWSDDDIQFSIDPTRADGYGLGFDGGGLRYTGGILANGTADLGNENDGSNHGTHMAGVQYSFYRDETNKVTYYLVSIPWTTLGVTNVDPAITNLGFASAINNNNGTGGRDGWLRYMDGIATGKNPALFGDLILGPAGATIPKNITGITATCAKSQYTEGSTIPASDLTVLLHYDDNSSATLTANDYTVGAYDNTLLDTPQTVTVTYTDPDTQTDYTDTFTVTFVEAPPSDILYVDFNYLLPGHTVMNDNKFGNFEYFQPDTNGMWVRNELWFGGNYNTTNYIQLTEDPTSADHPGCPYWGDGGYGLFGDKAAVVLGSQNANKPGLRFGFTPDQSWATMPNADGTWITVTAYYYDDPSNVDKKGTGFDLNMNFQTYGYDWAWLVPGPTSAYLQFPQLVGDGQWKTVSWTICVKDYADYDQCWFVLGGEESNTYTFLPISRVEVRPSTADDIASSKMVTGFSATCNTTFTVGQTLDAANNLADANAFSIFNDFADGSQEQIAGNFEATWQMNYVFYDDNLQAAPLDTSTPGEHTAKIHYSNWSDGVYAECTYVVNMPALTSWNFTAPTTLAYDQDSATDLDLTGMIVTLGYANNTSATYNDGDGLGTAYTFDGDVDFGTPGDYTVDVYAGDQLIGSFTVTINPIIINLTFTAPPVKSAYYTGDLASLDDLDLTGMVLTAEYSDQTTKTFNDGDGLNTVFTLGGTVNLGAKGTYTVNVLWNGQTIGSFTIKLTVAFNPAYDLNGDGKIDSNDLTFLMTYLGKKPSSSVAAKKCDLNGDNVIDAADYAILSAYINSL
jgi:hypothetical protein